MLDRQTHASSSPSSSRGCSLDDCTPDDASILENSTKASKRYSFVSTRSSRRRQDRMILRGLPTFRKFQTAGRRNKRRTHAIRCDYRLVSYFAISFHSHRLNGKPKKISRRHESEAHNQTGRCEARVMHSMRTLLRK